MRRRYEIECNYVAISKATSNPAAGALVGIGLIIATSSKYTKVFPHVKNIFMYITQCDLCIPVCRYCGPTTVGNNEDKSFVKTQLQRQAEYRRPNEEEGTKEVAAPLSEFSF